MLPDEADRGIRIHVADPSKLRRLEFRFLVPEQWFERGTAEKQSKLGAIFWSDVVELIG